MANNIKANITSKTKITLAGKYPGRYIEGEIPAEKGLLKAKLFLVGNRIYGVMVMGKSTWMKSANPERFLNSFTVFK